MKSDIFKRIDEIRLDSTISNRCGVTMNETVESRAIAGLMEAAPGITVTYMPAMIRIDGVGKITFRMPEISEVLGRNMTPQLFEVCISAHYGRMVLLDDETVVIFGDMNEALKHIDR